MTSSNDFNNAQGIFPTNTSVTPNVNLSAIELKLGLNIHQREHLHDWIKNEMHEEGFMCNMHIRANNQKDADRLEKVVERAIECLDYLPEPRNSKPVRGLLRDRVRQMSQVSEEAMHRNQFYRHRHYAHNPPAQEAACEDFISSEQPYRVLGSPFPPYVQQNPVESRPATPPIFHGFDEFDGESPAPSPPSRHVSVNEHRIPSTENNSDSDQYPPELASYSTSSTSDPSERMITLRELREQLYHLERQNEKALLERDEVHDEAMRNQSKNYDQCLARVEKARREEMVEMEAKYTKLLHEEGTGVDRFLQILESRLPIGTSSVISTNQRTSPSTTGNTRDCEFGNTKPCIDPISSRLNDLQLGRPERESRPARSEAFRPTAFLITVQGNWSYSAALRTVELVSRSKETYQYNVDDLDYYVFLRLTCSRLDFDVRDKLHAGFRVRGTDMEVNTENESRAALLIMNNDREKTCEFFVSSPSRQ